MTRLLIGSSNVYRFYKPELFPRCKPYIMVKCTKLEVFRAKMASLESTDKEIIISVVENFMCDAVRGATDNDTEFNLKLEEAIKEYLETIKGCATRFKETKFVIVRPTLRPAYKWYSENHEDICKAIDDGINKMNLANVGKLNGMSRMSQQFEDDEIHYTESAGRVFLDSILTAAETHFAAELINLDEEMDGPSATTASYVPTPISSGTFKFGSNHKKVPEEDRTKDRIVALEKEVGKKKLAAP